MELSLFALPCAAVALVLMWKRPGWRRTQALLMLVVGLALSGFSGVLRDRLAALATSPAATPAQRVFGVGLPYAVALVLVLWFAFDLDLDGLGRRGRGYGRNGHTTSAATPWLGLLVPIALGALPIVAWLPAVLRGGVTRLVSLLVG